jgi:hypothetical protein
MYPILRASDETHAARTMRSSVKRFPAARDLAGSALVKTAAGLSLGIFLALTVAIAMLLYGRGRFPNERTTHHIREQACPIVEALESYRRDNGIYPKMLSSLMPAYLQTLPDVEFGTHVWEYEASPKAYWLRVCMWRNHYEGYVLYRETEGDLQIGYDQ